MYQLRVNLSADNLKKNKPAQGEVDANTGLRLERNALWKVPHFEVGQDTPPDEMHVVMLGMVLHLMQGTVYKMTHFLRDFTKVTSTGNTVPFFSKAYVQR